MQKASRLLDVGTAAPSYLAKRLFVRIFAQRVLRYDTIGNAYKWATRLATGGLALGLGNFAVAVAVGPRILDMVEV